MAVNQQGIAISIKAFLPMGRALDDQLAALNLVKAAHETGDYAALLAASQDVEVKTEQKTRRVEAAPKIEVANAHGIGPDTDGGPNPDYQPEADIDPPQTTWAEDPALPLDPTPTTSKKKGNGNE